MPTIIDMSVPPIVLVRWPEALSTDDFDDYCDQQEVDFNLKAPYGLIFESLKLDRMGFRERHHIALASRRLMQNQTGLCLATAVVIQSIAARGLVNAILWTVQPTNPVKFFASVAEAREWAMMIVEKHQRTDSARA